MPSWAKVLELLGFATPLLYAGATYGFFHWLDKKASGPAKRAISEWLEPREYDRADVQAAVLEIFDRVYTKPLMAWRAFFRSAIITIGASPVLIYNFDREISQSLTFFTNGYFELLVFFSSRL
jgi:hypothetical protein